MRVCVIIPAAGASRRFGEQDKLSQDLGGRALLLRSVEPFTKHDAVSSIIVVGPHDDEAYESFREKYAATLGFHGASVVKGGKTERWETVKAALEYVSDDCTHIAVHDAARPAVSAELIARVMEAAGQAAAVAPGVAVRDTIKRGQPEERDLAAAEEDALAASILGDAGRTAIPARRVIETIDRGHLFAMQTPQVFERDVLLRAYGQDDLSGATDDAQLVERLGEPVEIVRGEASNIKVTTPSDLKLVRAILGVKAPAQRPAHKRF